MAGSDPNVKIDVCWKGALLFEASNEQGAKAVVDGESVSSLSPMQGLLAALAGCMAVDVVLILQKMRAAVRGLEISVRGTRNEEPPRYYRTIHLDFSVRGDVARDRVEHAVRLSFDTYCSVFHTLRKDLEVDFSIQTEP